MPEAPLRFSDAQEAVIRAGGREVWVTAAAGSGKTGCLVERLARRLCESPEAAAEIVAFTFTRKAAQQMLSRLREQLWRGQERQAARAVDQLRIGTIDSFCVQILREHAVEAGLDPRFRVLDPVEAEVLERQAARQALEEAAGRGAEELRPWLLRFEADALSACLVDAARALRSAGDAEGLLAAWETGEGASFEAYSSGFEARRVELQHRLLAEARGPVERAAGHASRKPEQQERARSALARLARPTWDFAAWHEIREALTAATGPRDLRADFKLAREPAWTMLSFGKGPWAVIRERHDAFDDEELYRHLRAFLPLLRSYLQRFAEARRRQIPPRLDFQDVMLEVLRLSGRSPAFRAFCRDRLRHLLVDELQDVNGLQSQLIATLGGDAATFGVGDPMQSIYRFRHADVELFTERLAGADGSARVARELQENYRSRPGIVEFVNQVFPRMCRSLGAAGAPELFRALAPRRPAGTAAGPAVELLRVGEEPAAGVPARELRLAEARAVAERLWRLHQDRFPVPLDGARETEADSRARPLEWRDVAVLFRSSTAIPTYARALAEAGIPVETQHQAELLASVEGRDLVALLQVLHNPRQDLPLAAVLRSPFVDLSDGALLRLAREAAARVGPGEDSVPLFEVLGGPRMAEIVGGEEAGRAGEFLERLASSRDRVLTEGASSLLREWLDAAGYLAREGARRAGDQVAANLHAFLERCREVEPSRGDLAGLLERLRALGESERGPREGALPAGRGVQLVTIHAAKGLEFPVVVVAQLGRGWKNPKAERSPLALRFTGSPRRVSLAARLGPSFGDERDLRGWAELLLAADEDLDNRLEELRLFYVAATRAREKLVLAGTRTLDPAGGAGWTDGYGAWLDAALEELAAGGADLDALLARTDLRAAGIRRPGRAHDRARPLWEVHGDLIAAGCSLPVPVDSAAAAEAQRILEQVTRPVPAPALAPRDIGAADLGRALLCPWRHLYRDFIEEVTGDAARGGGSAGGTASERGERVHAFFEHWDPARPVLEDFDRAAGRAGLTEDDRRDLREWLGQPEVAAALLELSRPGAEARRELVFEWSVNGTRISGRLDALVRLPDGAWRVLDFKTDSSERLAALYERQTAVYAAAVERAGLGRVAGRRLIYVRRGSVTDLQWAAGDTDRLEEEAARTLLLLGQGGDLKSPACSDCELKKTLGRSCVAGT